MRPATTTTLLICLCLALAGCGKRDAAAPTTSPDPGGAAQAKTAKPAKPAAPVVRPERAPARPPSAALDGPGSAAAQASTSGVDVLLRATGLAWDAATLSAAIRPIVGTLRKANGVSHVWSRVEDGEVRVLVRHAKGAVPQQALEAALEAWRATPPRELAPPTGAVIQRGQRALAALTVVAAGGLKEATALLATRVMPRARALPGVSWTDIAGAQRRYQVIQWMPPYLDRWGVPLGAAQRGLRRALATGKGTLSARLDATREKGAKGKPVALSDLAVLVTGEGEPGRTAYTGKRRITTGLLECGANVEVVAFGQRVSEAITRGVFKALPRGTETFYHPLSAMHRFRVRAPEGRDAEGLKLFRERLHRLATGGMFHDLLVVGGMDGVPTSMQDHAFDGRVWTLWAATGNSFERERIYEAVQGALKGWQVTPLHAADDTALRWLLGAKTTTAAVFASRDVPRMTRELTAVTRGLAQERRLVARSTGPQRRPARAGVSTLNRKAAQQRGVAALDLALAQRMKRDLVMVGALDGVPVWAGLPTGAMSARHGDLLLAGNNANWRWSSLLQVADGSQTTPRIQVDGLPVMWYGGSPVGDAPDIFAGAFWTAIEQHASPSKSLDIRSLILEQEPLSVARRAK